MKRFGIETREVKGENHGLYGKERREEVKREISVKLTGREFSQESLRRMSEAHEGQSLSEDVREKISNSLSGVPKSDETRLWMSRAKIGDVDVWSEKHRVMAAYGFGYRPARRKVRQRDEVCQICNQDGPDSNLEAHHIIPIRLFRDSEHLTFKDAHCLGNIILLCRSCHPRVEWGNIDIKPDFESTPIEQHKEFRGLWRAYSKWKESNASEGGLKE